MISVCIPTYNGEKFITEQLISILRQLADNDEIIISDDNSTDKTLEKIEAIGDSRIKIFHHHKSRSVLKYRYMYATLNLENALMQAKGDYIYLSDQDDIWAPGKVKLTQQFLQHHLLVCSDCEIIDAEGNTLVQSYFEWNNSKKGIVKNMIKNSYLGCCMAFKRELLGKVLPISKFNVPHDIWIGLIAEYYGSVYFDQNKQVNYRRHDNNLSPSGGSSINGLYFKISYRLILLSSFLLRIFKLK
ncbi:glycosyltransferase [Pedobacter sp.]|uniref:glycosyltransferase n=1 Tax=Pedobacter sp. TaxID=1411316 RepID=UPI003D7F42DA